MCELQESTLYIFDCAIKSNGDMASALSYIMFSKLIQCSEVVTKESPKSSIIVRIVKSRRSLTIRVPSAVAPKIAISSASKEDLANRN